jgi:uncharacterized protein (TIGR02246 family)
MKPLTPILMLFLAVMPTACSPPAPDLAAEGQAVMQRSRAWSNVVSTGEVDTILTYWADDAVMLAPGIPPLEGKQAIRSFVETALQTPGFQMSWEPLSVHVAESGDLAYLLESNLTIVSDPMGNPMRMEGKAVTIWRKDPDGVWRNVVDAWSGNEPGM